MSAGNVVLYSNFLAPGTFPSTTTLLGSGNYWIEEVDFTLGYVNTSAIVTESLAFQLQYGSTTFWYSYLALVQSAAGITAMNISIISRPRIFLPRSNSVSINLAGPGATTTQVVFSISLYGRSLP